MELKLLKAGLYGWGDKRRDGECSLGCSMRGMEDTPEGDTRHQEHTDGLPNDRRVLLSGTFLAFHLRKMPDGHNVRNVLKNNKFLQVTEHISSLLSKKPAVTTQIYCLQPGLLLSYKTRFPLVMMLKHEVIHRKLRLESWHLGRHHQPHSVKLFLSMPRERAGKTLSHWEHNHSFFHSLSRSFSQPVFEELVHVRICAWDPIVNHVWSLKEYRIYWPSLIGHEQLLHRVISGMIKLKMECCGGKCGGTHLSRGKKWQRKIAQGNG